MLTTEVFGLKYSRLLANSISLQHTNILKEKFDYSFIVSYDGIFNDSDYQIVDKNSCIIDIKGGQDSIINGFNSTSRNELKRSFRTEALTFEYGFTNFETYYNFYKECENARGWYPVPENELKKCELFTVKYNGKFISGMSCYSGDNTIRVSRIYSNRRINTNTEITGTIYGSAAKRLVFEICIFALKNGFERVDLGGVDFNDPLKAGISHFKTSLGGILIPVKIGRFKKQSFIEKESLIKEYGYDIT